MMLLLIMVKKMGACRPYCFCCWFSYYSLKSWWKTGGGDIVGYHKILFWFSHTAKGLSVMCLDCYKPRCCVFWSEEDVAQNLMFTKLPLIRICAHSIQNKTPTDSIDSTCSEKWKVNTCGFDPLHLGSTREQTSNWNDKRAPMPRAVFPAVIEAHWKISNKFHRVKNGTAQRRHS